MTSGNDLQSFTGIVLFLSVSPLFIHVTSAGDMCTWLGGSGLLYQCSTLYETVVVLE